MSNTHDFDVAVIGMTGRFPGADGISSFWENLKRGTNGISFFSDEELEGEVTAADLRNPNYVKAGGVVANIDLFDAAFFSISAREAEWMDPQQRLFLEGAWEALESAGYDPFSYPGTIAVYAGLNTNTYLLGRLGQLEIGDPASYFRILLSNEKDHLATRVSYKLNLRGESVTVQTSCSTSLVAVHLAYQSVLSGQSNMALAGGISLHVPAKTGYFYQEGMVVSPDGCCRPFDSKASGTVPGQGFGIVVLKLLSEAVKDGDQICAVIKGSAINNDGHEKIGYTAPSVEAQADVISRALAMSGITVDQISYVESHGTGTPLGDPIEVEALTRAYRRHTQRKQYCVLGAVKSMIGHLDNAAGVAGLIATVLALQHKQLPPTLHFEEPNPMLDLENSPFRVNKAPSNWETGEAGRFAGLSCFGIGGTNVHMILAESPLIEETPPSARPQIITLSAKSPSALKRMSEQLAAHLEGHTGGNVADVAYTRNVGRSIFDYRAYVTGGNREELTAPLKMIADMNEGALLPAPNTPPKLAFLFPGQGTQKLEMAAEVYRVEAEFRGLVDACLAFIRAKVGLDLYGYFSAAQPDAASVDTLAQPGISLPLLFTIEYALARLWMGWGLQPQALMGHSFGEYAAACLAGLFTVEDSLSLAIMRGRLMQQLSPGVMIAVRLSEEQVKPFLRDGVALAAVNSGEDCTISGDVREMSEVEKLFREQGIGFRRMDVRYAYHSSMVEPILKEFGSVFRHISFGTPTLPFVSSLTGTWINPRRVMTSEYWVNQMRQPVQFARGIECLQQSSIGTFLEIGAAPILTPLVRQNLERGHGVALASFDGSQMKKGGAAAILHTMGRLWVSGCNFDWSRFYAGERRRRVELPTYPFERKKHWIDVNTGETAYVPNDPESEQALTPNPEISVRAKSSDRTTPAIESSGRRQGSAAHLSPRNELEMVLLEVWSEVLGYPDIGIADSFFELGGDSLTAAQIYARLKKTIALEFSLDLVLSHPTIADSSSALQKEIKQAAGLPMVDQHLPFYCRFCVRLGEEQMTVYMTQNQFAEAGLPAGAEEFSLV